MISKQISEEHLEKDPSWRTRLSLWLDDHNPVPLRWQFWWENQDWLHPIRVLRKIGGVARWVPVLWNDVDWDHAGLFYILETKLRFMRECHEADRIHVGWEATAAQIRVAEDCAGRLKRDEYCVKEWEQHYDKYPRDWKITKRPDGLLSMSRMSDESRDAFHAIAEKEEQQRKADLARLFRTIEDNVMGWWN